MRPEIFRLQVVSVCTLLGASRAGAQQLEQDLPYAWTGGPIWLWLIVSIIVVAITAAGIGFLLRKNQTPHKRRPRLRKADRSEAWSRTEDALAPPKPTAARLPLREAATAKLRMETSRRVQRPAVS